MVKPWEMKIINTSPLERYHQFVEQGTIQSDAEQLKALNLLNAIQKSLIKEQADRFGLMKIFHKNCLIKGLYLWGGVGIGKTFMMDCFYETLPFQQKMRMHFHVFMQKIHDELNKHQGEADPLQKIAMEIANKTLVICFDELFVSDIADAMLLGRLFKALFNEKVTLIATSNTAPDDLYKNGLQRLQFLPAIALIKKNTEVLNITSKIDYRLRHLKEAGIFYTPLNKASEEKMQAAFDLITAGKKVSTTPINLYGRNIKVIKQSSGVVWFDFKDICSVPRSQHDYLAIAREYHTVFISNVPIISESARDTICLFVSLIDVLYDAKVKLVISAAESVPELYSKGYMILEYARTQSRLIEMQSEDYFTGDI